MLELKRLMACSTYYGGYYTGGAERHKQKSGWNAKWKRGKDLEKTMNGVARKQEENQEKRLIVSVKHIIWTPTLPGHWVCICDPADMRLGDTYDSCFKITRGTWVAQLVKHPTSARSWSHSSWVHAPYRALYSQLRAWSLLQILSPSLSVPPPLACSFSLPLSQK